MHEHSNEQLNNNNKNPEDKKRTSLFTNILLVVLIIIIILLLLKPCVCGPVPELPPGNATPTTEADITLKPTATPVVPMDGTGEANEGEEYDPEKIKEKLNAEQRYCNIKACNYMELENADSYGLLKYENNNDFYVQISIMPYDNDIADVSKAYFTSIVLAPGEEMNKVQFTKNLENLREGNQPCLLLCSCFTKDEAGIYQYIGNGGLKITINLKNKQ